MLISRDEPLAMQHSSPHLIFLDCWMLIISGIIDGHVSDVFRE